MAEQRWVFVVKSLDQPGALTAATAIFSNRGISLEAILGSGIAATSAEDARIILSFRATERRKKMLLRVLERLSTVLAVNTYAYDDPQLRAIAVAKVLHLVGIDLESVISETISQTETGQTLLFTGSALAVEALIKQLRQQSLLIDIVTTAITV